MSRGVAEGMAIAAAVIAVGLVVAYLAYTLAEQLWIAPLLGRPRRVAFAAAAAAALFVVVAQPAPSVIAPAALALAATSYAWWRQWLLPWRATRASRAAAAIRDDSPVLVLPDGSALPLADVKRHRVIATETCAVVQCGVARSVSIFSLPSPGTLRAMLPHPSGFWLTVSSSSRSKTRSMPANACRKYTHVLSLVSSTSFPSTVVRTEVRRLRRRGGPG